MNEHTPARIEYVQARIRVAPDGCWNWTLALTKGYGQACFAGIASMAHRFSYETHVGPIPDGLQIDHLCRNRACVNPDHLEVVTLAENVARSMVPSVVSRRDGVCVRGLHEMAGSNLYVRPDGRRVCRTCNTAARHARRAKTKAA